MEPAQEDKIEALSTFEIPEHEAEDPHAEIRGMVEVAQKGEFECATTRPAKYPYGVMYRGPWETEWMGVQSSVRRHARALSKTGMPVWLVSVNHYMQYVDDDGRIQDSFADHTNLSWLVRKQVGHLTDCRHRDTLVSIEHRVFSPEAITTLAYPARMGRVDPGYVQRVNATTILFTVFERSRPDPETTRAAFVMSSFGEIWVPCKRNAKVLVDSGVPAEKVVVMPHPVPGDDPVWNYSHRPPKDRLRFINIGKWEPRKAQHDLIGGFLQCFTPTSGAELVIKYSDFGSGWVDYPDRPQQSIATWLGNEAVRSKGWTIDNVGSCIRLFGDYFPRSAIVRMLAESHVYVSAGRAEGFDMPALDAKIMGLRLIVMGHGGAEDFCSKSDILWDSPEADAHPGYGWKQATWAGHDASDIAAAFRVAVALERHNKPKMPFGREAYSERVIGQRMLDRCIALSKRLGGTVEFEPVEEYLNA